jgi:YHS domain-containing protein/TusA-related sulfurtransferase
MQLKNGLILGAAAIFLVSGMATAGKHWGGGKCGKMGKMVCPMMVEGAEVKVDNIANGAVITVTSGNAETVKKIQEGAKTCMECKLEKTAATQGEKTGAAAKQSAEEMVVCPVMGTEFPKSKTAATREYKGKTYYLCCQQCIVEFDKNPEKNAK